jgi:hypothetical protein
MQVRHRGARVERLRIEDPLQRDVGVHPLSREAEVGSHARRRASSHELVHRATERHVADEVARVAGALEKQRPRFDHLLGGRTGRGGRAALH